MVPIAASSRDQTEIMYTQAAGFVIRADIDGNKWAKGFKCLEGYRRIRFDGTNSRIQVFAADDRTGDGVIPTLALVDELHRHRDLRLYRTWRGKLAKRQGQIITISTSGEPGSEFELTREKIRQGSKVTRKGSFVRAETPSLVLHEWAVPEGDDVEDMKVVKSANPLKAITVPALREKYDTHTMTLSHWRRFVCNLPTRADAAAITEAEWFAATADEEIPPGVPIWLGLDVAWKWDTTALVPYWQDGPEHRLLGPATILVPPRDGNSLDPALVEDALFTIRDRNPIHTVVMDTSSAEQLAHWIQTDIGAAVVDRQQTNKLATEDYNRFMEALRNGWLKHAGDQGLTTHALNAIARVLPYGDARFDRPSQSRGGPEQVRRVIDALTAASMVHTVATIVTPPPAPVAFVPFD